MTNPRHLRPSGKEQGGEYVKMTANFLNPDGSVRGILDFWIKGELPFDKPAYLIYPAKDEPERMAK